MSETKALYAGVTREPVRALDDARQIAQLRSLFEEVTTVYRDLSLRYGAQVGKSLYTKHADVMFCMDSYDRRAREKADAWMQRLDAIVTGNVDSRAVGREREER